jgi:uncharacterized BrkB/YihY/UPF0761 family membrane protein
VADVPGNAGRTSRLRARVEALRARALEAGRSLERRYGDRPSVAIARDVALLDRAVAGTELAGALAYRLFLWFLPFVLVLVAGLGIYADASDQTAREAADQVGLAGLVLQSVSEAASSSARWYALLIGVPTLLYLTRSLLRTLVAVHRLAWQLEPERGQLTPRNVLVFLAALVASITAAALLTAPTRSSPLSWPVAVPLVVVLRSGVWLVLSRRLPARDRRLTTLLPGAVVVGVGLLAANVFTQLVVVWLGNTREDTYGALGLAATILFSLWLTSRVLVASAVLNAALWARREGPGRPAP